MTLILLLLRDGLAIRANQSLIGESGSTMISTLESLKADTVASSRDRVGE